jgi:hypothetical protein
MPDASHALPAVQELPERVRRRVGTFGHHLALFAEALGWLQGRWEKGKLPEPLMAHLSLGLAGLPEMVLPEAFEVEVEVPQEQPETWCVATLGQVWPWAGSRARALLHLPGLRPMWSGWLRASVVEDLRDRLPPAWLLDHAPIPPSGAIAGLGIAGWQDLGRLRASGRAFRVTFADNTHPVTCLGPGDGAEVWQAMGERLKRTVPGGAVVEAIPAMQPPLWRAAYARVAGRWEMTDLDPADASLHG